MDPVRNPFAPGAGTPPPELAGRQAILDQADVALRRIAKDRSAKSLILVGLRGVGKTVLLTKIHESAASMGYKSELLEIRENVALAEQLVPVLRRLLLSVDFVQRAGDRGRRALRTLLGFVKGLKLKFGELDVGLGIEPELGTADSGDLESDLAELFVSVGEAAKAADTAVCLCLDEMQYLGPVELSALIMAVHRLNQRVLPVLVVGAALPQILGIAGQAKSYAERLFDYPRVGPLTREHATAALRNPVIAEGAEISAEAVARTLDVTQGYPYFLQQWGHEAWNLAPDSEIDLPTVEAASSKAVMKLDENFFRVRFDRCTPAEKRYLRALADLGPGPQRSGDIADRLGVKVTSVGPTRSKLIQKGMIYSPQHGDTEFTVPMFDGYLRRAMPDGTW